jgi:hypothetical protein
MKRDAQCVHLGHLKDARDNPRGIHPSTKLSAYPALGCLMAWQAHEKVTKLDSENVTFMPVSRVRMLRTWQT